jgi:formiminotetrahydrofolate cyclodeaminase
MHDRSTTIDAFLNATASKQPTPGGGAVAALAGALAAAIGEMVLAYSVGKKGLAEYQPQLEGSLKNLKSRRERLLQSIVDDQVAFSELTAAKKLPAEDPARAGRIRAAVQACIECPVEIAMRALQILTECRDLVPRVNRFLLSDLAVSAELAIATVRSAGHNVRANLPSLDAEKDRAELVELVDGMEKTSVGLIRSVIPAIWARVDAE